MLNGARNKTLKRRRAATRILIVTTALVCAAVFAFAVYMIAATDRVAEYVSRGYGTSEQSLNAASTLEIAVLRLRGALEDFVRQPDPAEEIDLDALTGEMRQAAQGISWPDSSAQQRTEVLLERISEGSREVIADVLAGRRSEAAGRLEEMLPVFGELDTALGLLLEAEQEAAAQFVAQTTALNARINQTSVIFAVIVIALALGLSIYAARVVEHTNADVYERDKILNLISTNVDEVFQVYDISRGQLTFVSENLTRILGVTPQAYRTDNNCMRGNINPDDLVILDKMYYDTAFDPSNGTQQADFRYKNPRTGKMQICRTTLYPIRSENGVLVQHVLLTRDVTEESQIRHDLEEALKKAEAANHAKLEFLSRMSHEIRTPINGIIGMEALATQAIGHPKRVSHFLRQVNVSARHLLSLVNDILDMSKIESGRFELSDTPINMEALLADLEIMVSTRTEQKKQQLSLDSRQLTHVNLKGDELRLRQVLLNLLGNASKYTPEGGVISLTVTEQVRDGDTAALTFTVTDNGPGIAPEERERIFLPFERGQNSAKQNGTGLGLSISSHIVEEMGGILHLESTLGLGSTFTFTIPLKLDEEVTPHLHQLQPRGRILVVEDNLINMEIACEILRGCGYEVLTAEDGAQGLEVFEKEPPGSIDAVLMDLQMPVMDGYETAARMRAEPERLRDAPILAMTANVFSREETKQKELFDGYISKPVEPDRMSTIIETARQKKKEQDNERRDQTDAD